MAGAATGSLVALAAILAVSAKWELGLRRVAPWLMLASAGSFLIAGIVIAPEFGDAVAGIAAFAFVVGASVAVLAWRFYRDPERIAPVDPRAVVSPADGVVVYVRPTEAGEAFAEKHGRRYRLPELDGTQLGSAEATVIGIAMSYLDVHVNRAPIGGRVIRQRRRPGRFASLKRPEAILENERVTTVLESDELQIAIVQIASRLVRRIVLFVREGASIAGGDRLGAIRLGSQVDVVLPSLEGLELHVTVGERVYAGESIIAHLPVTVRNALAPAETMA
jgi:phosphatidylserine decarboxylase